MVYKIKAPSRKTHKTSPEENIAKKIRMVDIFLQKNNLTIGIIILVCVVLGIVFYLSGGVDETIMKDEYLAKQQYNKENPEDMKKSLETYENLLVRNPGNAGLYLMEIGNLHTDLKEYSKAIESFESLLKKSSNKAIIPIAYLKIGYLYLKVDDKDKAVKAFGKIIKITGANNKDIAYLELGTLSEASGDTKKAEEYYDAIIKDYMGTPISSEAQARLNILRKDQEVKDEEKLKKDAIDATGKNSKISETPASEKPDTESSKQ